MNSHPRRLSADSQVLELDAPGPPELHYDEEWLAVMRSTHHLVNLRFAHAPLPGKWVGACSARKASESNGDRCRRR